MSKNPRPTDCNNKERKKEGKKERKKKEKERGLVGKS
jgi:hypothetical protein